MEMLKLAFEKLTGNIALFVKHWDLDRLVLDGDTVAPKLIKIPSSAERYLFVRTKWTNAYITKAVGDVGKLYIATIDCECLISSLDNLLYS